MDRDLAGRRMGVVVEDVLGLDHCGGEYRDNRRRGSSRPRARPSARRAAAWPGRPDLRTVVPGGAPARSTPRSSRVVSAPP
jgi:hypothetical protein